ncbi:MAG: oxygen-independent coproporphyrinogen III oxidase-like protein [Betaproteobacteria bacterium]|nr:MAG: oxygen-independent coproporphyrinogen III oxidase-like protein [Betaproteobacteria bacterium]TMG76291.1 MAG: oxygen-independent coproporphyrinogen III oxidase-like protein [Betaproteobacteria bacterium]
MSVAIAPSPSGVRLAQLPPLALYVHIPWCVRKCPYCDFNSHQAKGDTPERAYVEALVTDLELALPDVWGRRVYSVFFGGGTPSLFSAAAIETLISAFRARLPLAADCEITLEANPGTFEAEKFRGYREAGVNRLSIGVQSFNPEHLKALGRIHDDKEARRAIEIAKASFENINLDLMYALPQQTPTEALADVEAALEVDTAHLSFYHLTIEPNTLFHRHPPKLPEEDAAAAMQDAIGTALADGGYVHYETSAWARPGRECRHNLNYWRFGDYLGIGAGAHSKLSFPDRVARAVRWKQPKEYLQRVAEGRPVQESHDVQRADLVFEFMMNALRLPEGFAVGSFVERTGLQIAVAEKPLAQAETRGLILRDHERIRPTDLGQRFLNDLLQLFLPVKSS